MLLVPFCYALVNICMSDVLINMTCVKMNDREEMEENRKSLV